MGVLLKPSTQSSTGIYECFGYEFGVANERHKIGIAIPAREDMHVQVCINAGSRNPSQVHAEVEAMRVIFLGQECNAALGQKEHFLRTVLMQARQVGGVLIGHHHHMRGIVGVKVQHHITC